MESKWTQTEAERSFAGHIAVMAQGMVTLTGCGALMYVNAVYIDKKTKAADVRAWLAEQLTGTLAYKDRAARAYGKDMFELAKWLCEKYGRPDRASPDAFWEAVYSGDDFNASVQTLVSELNLLGITTQGELQERLYDRPAKPKAAPANGPVTSSGPAEPTASAPDGGTETDTVVEPTVATKHDILAALLAMDDADGAWVVKAYIAARQARDAAPAARQIAA